MPVNVYPSTIQGAGIAWAAAPATCGELFQGTVEGGPCLVSLPIDRWSVVEVNVDERRRGWQILPRKEKSRRALQVVAGHWRLPAGGRLRWVRELPEGKGYGSSTADIGAVLGALGQATGRQLTPWEVTRWAVEIEPTDSSLLPGLALLSHRDGKNWRSLGTTPPLSVFVVDTGGEMDTLAFNRIDYRSLAARFGRRHEELFAVLEESLESGDLEGVGWAATGSARLQQSILPKPGLERWLTLAQETGALGVNAAHSGTLIGLLYRPQVDRGGIEGFLRSRVDGIARAGWTRSINGGVRVCSPQGPLLK